MNLAQMCGGNTDQACTVTGYSATLEEWGWFVNLLDSNFATHWHSKNSNTDTEWVRIDLGMTSLVRHLQLWPQPTYAMRSRATIRIGDLESTTANEFCGALTITNDNDDAVKEITCNLKGRYVYLLFLDSSVQWKTMMEVKVFGVRTDTGSAPLNVVVKTCTTLGCSTTTTTNNTSPPCPPGSTIIHDVCWVFMCPAGQYHDSTIECQNMTNTACPAGKGIHSPSARRS